MSRRDRLRCTEIGDRRQDTGCCEKSRSWKIPKNAVLLESAPSVYAEAETNGIPDVYQISPFRIAMPLLNSSYPVGKCMEYINTIPDPDDRNIALAEYYFFTGRSDYATKMIEPYLDSHDPSLHFYAIIRNGEQK